jgi:hypothetical protein
MKNRTILGFLFFLSLIAAPIFGSIAENPRQGFDGIFTGLYQGVTLSKAATAPGLSACFLESSRQVFLLGQGGKLLPALDSTGKVHGILPKIKDLAKYSAEELKILLQDLKQSVQQRIRKNVELGFDKAHAQRQAAEQQLIIQIEKFLGLR